MQLLTKFIESIWMCGERHVNCRVEVEVGVVGGKRWNWLCQIQIGLRFHPSHHQLFVPPPITYCCRLLSQLLNHSNKCTLTSLQHTDYHLQPSICFWFFYPTSHALTTYLEISTRFCLRFPYLNSYCLSELHDCMTMLHFNFPK